MVTTLVQRGFPSDPVKAWKDLQKKAPEEDLDDDASSVASSTSSSGGPDFGYLLSMSLLSLSREKKEELLKERDNKVSSIHNQVQITSRDQFYKTFTSVICKCSYCFQTLKQWLHL